MEVEKVKNKSLKKKGIVVKTKEEKRKLRRAKDKERKRKKRGKGSQEDQLDFNNPKFSDNVKFNEVVHAPPENLLKVGNYTERRPGRQKDLLLTKKLNPQNKRENNNITKPKPKNSISLARKCMLEEERKRVIEQYRKLKKSKLS